MTKVNNFITENKNKASSPPGTWDLLGIAFIVLKLTHEIDWSWWWVTLPFWGVPVFILGGAIVIFTVTLLGNIMWEVGKKLR